MIWFALWRAIIKAVHILNLTMNIVLFGDRCSQSNLLIDNLKVKYIKKISPLQNCRGDIFINKESYLLLIAACAAANLAIGTRNGEQDT